MPIVLVVARAIEVGLSVLQFEGEPLYEFAVHFAGGAVQEVAAHHAVPERLDAGFFGELDALHESPVAEDSGREIVRPRLVDREGGPEGNDGGAEDPGAVYTKYIANFFKFATIVLAVASSVMTVISLLKTNDTEQLPIPEYMVDNVSRGDEPNLVNYKAVQCNRNEYFGNGYKKQKGSCADLLCDEGKQWLVLYAAKNKTSGAPITADIVVQKSKDAPQGFENEISLIGELGAVNLASKAFRDYSAFSQIWQNVTSDYSTYVFYKTDNTVLPAGEPDKGNVSVTNSVNTANTFNAGTAVIFGCIGLVLGGALGAVITVLVNKNKKKKETES